MIETYSLPAAAGIVEMTQCTILCTNGMFVVYVKGGGYFIYSFGISIGGSHPARVQFTTA